MVGQSFDSLTRQSRASLPRAGQNQHRHGVHNLLPTPPFWQLGEVVCPHQPDELRPGEAFFKRCHGVGGVNRPEFLFDIGGDDPPAVDNFAGRSQPVGKWGHAERWFQRVAWGYHEPELVEPAVHHRLPGHMQMPCVSWIERAAQHADS